MSTPDYSYRLNGSMNRGINADEDVVLAVECFEYQHWLLRCAGISHVGGPCSSSLLPSEAKDSIFRHEPRQPRGAISVLGVALGSAWRDRTGCIAPHARRSAPVSLALNSCGRKTRGRRHKSEPRPLIGQCVSFSQTNKTGFRVSARRTPCYLCLPCKTLPVTC